MHHVSCHTSIFIAWNTQDVGLKVTDVVVLIDREQGGQARLASHGLNLHSAFTLSFILDTLLAAGKVTPQLADTVRAFVAANQTSGGSAPAPAVTQPPARYGNGGV